MAGQTDMPLTIDRGDADSDRNPMFVLERLGNLDYVTCDGCGRDLTDFPNDVRGWIGGNYRPAAIYRAAVWCSDCQPYSYDDHTLELLDTLTGVAVSEDS